MTDSEKRRFELAMKIMKDYRELRELVNKEFGITIGALDVNRVLDANLKLGGSSLLQERIK